jgi:hypothetical protein
MLKRTHPEDTMASNNSPQAVEVKVVFIEEVVKGRIQADSIFPECNIYQTFRNNPIAASDLIFVVTS